MLSRKEIADILYVAANIFFKLFGDFKTSVTFKEVHLTEKLRADIFNISILDKVVIIEIKTCRADFEHDGKWMKYLDYCDRFFFMCPDGVILPEELPDKIGLIYVNITNPKNPTLKVVKRPKFLNPKFITNSWLKYIYKKLTYRKFAKVNNQLIDLENEKIFKT